MLPLQTRVDMGVMAMEGYSIFHRAPALLSYPSAEMQGQERDEEE